MKNLSTNEILELFFNLKIDIKELIEYNNIDLKSKLYFEKLSFHKVYNGQNIYKDIYEKKGKVLVKKGNPIAFFKAMKDGMEKAEEDTLKKIIYLNSDAMFPTNSKLRSNCKIVSKELVETKRGYALKVKINEKLSLKSALNRRVRYLEFNKESLKYDHKKKVFSFNFLGKTFIYNSSLSSLNLGKLLDGNYEDFFIFLNENYNDIERVFKTKLSCEVIAHKWTIIKSEDNESAIKSIGKGYFAKGLKVLELVDNYLLIFEYSDIIRNIPDNCKIINNFRDILTIDGIDEIDSDYDGYSRCMITHTNQIKTL